MDLNNFDDRLKNPAKLRTLFSEKHTCLISYTHFQRVLSSLQVSRPRSSFSVLGRFFSLSPSLLPLPAPPHPLQMQFSSAFVQLGPVPWKATSPTPAINRLPTGSAVATRVYFPYGKKSEISLPLFFYNQYKADIAKKNKEISVEFFQSKDLLFGWFSRDVYFVSNFPSWLFLFYKKCLRLILGNFWFLSSLRTKILIQTGLFLCLRVSLISRPLLYRVNKIILKTYILDSRLISFRCSGWFTALTITRSTPQNPRPFTSKAHRGTWIKAVVLKSDRLTTGNCP